MAKRYWDMFEKSFFFFLIFSRSQNLRVEKLKNMLIIIKSNLQSVWLFSARLLVALKWFCRCYPNLYTVRHRFGLVLWHINHGKLFNDKSYLYIYIKYIWFVNTFCCHHFKTSLISFFCTQLNGFKYFNVSRPNSIICLHTFVWSNSSISNNSI